MFAACEAFASLAQETRLRIFRLLVEFGRSGVPAGKLAEELGIPPNTLSFHLAHLSRAGLVRAEKSGRSVSYFARTDLIATLIGFLQESCCAREGAGGKKGKKRGPGRC